MVLILKKKTPVVYSFAIMLAAGGKVSTTDTEVLKGSKIGLFFGQPLCQKFRWGHDVCLYIVIYLFFALCSLAVQSWQTMCSGIQEAAAIGCEMKIGRLQQ